MELYIIAGPNGAGKTTFAGKFLPKYVKCTNFVNADLIAKGLAPFAPDTAAIRAGRLMLSEIDSFARRKKSFAFETTLSGKGYLKLIEQLREHGYKVHLFYLWVEGVDVAAARVRERVLKGGHHVPDAELRRRYGRSIRNFLGEYRALADTWYFFDNTGMEPEIIAFGDKGESRIMNEERYAELSSRYGSK